jgi:hypothetical protein
MGLRLRILPVCSLLKMLMWRPLQTAVVGVCVVCVCVCAHLGLETCVCVCVDLGLETTSVCVCVDLGLETCVCVCVDLGLETCACVCVDLGLETTSNSLSGSSECLVLVAIRSPSEISLCLI